MAIAMIVWLNRLCASMCLVFEVLPMLRCRVAAVSMAALCRPPPAIYLELARIAGLILTRGTHELSLGSTIAAYVSVLSTWRQQWHSDSFSYQLVLSPVRCTDCECSASSSTTSGVHFL
jgi:hypothetical protein